MSKVFLFLIALVWACSSAQAEVSSSVSYKRGLMLYKKGNYPEALIEFEAAYGRSKLPRLLINMGQTHYKLKQLEQALSCFERFLSAEPNAPSELRARVVDRVSQVHDELAARRATALLPATTPTLEPMPHSPPTVAVSQPGLLSRRESVPVVRRWWFWGGLSLATASVIGLGLGVSIGQRADDLRRPVFPPASVQ